MEIKLSDDLRIEGTEHCWVLQRRRVVKGEERWESFKWYPTFGSAVSGALHRDIRLHPAKSLVEAIQAVTNLVHRYTKLIPCEFEIRLKDENQ